MCPKDNDKWAKFSQKHLIKLPSQEQDKYIYFILIIFPWTSIKGTHFFLI